jgi:hypothetical protein
MFQVVDMKLTGSHPSPAVKPCKCAKRLYQYRLRQHSTKEVNSHISATSRIISRRNIIQTTHPYGVQKGIEESEWRLAVGKAGIIEERHDGCECLVKNVYRRGRDDG